MPQWKHNKKSLGPKAQNRRRGALERLRKLLSDNEKWLKDTKTISKSNSEDLQIKSSINLVNNQIPVVLKAIERQKKEIGILEERMK